MPHHRVHKVLTDDLDRHQNDASRKMLDHAHKGNWQAAKREYDRLEAIGHERDALHRAHKREVFKRMNEG